MIDKKKFAISNRFDSKRGEVDAIDADRALIEFAKGSWLSYMDIIDLGYTAREVTCH